MDPQTLGGLNPLVLLALLQQQGIGGPGGGGANPTMDDMNLGAMFANPPGLAPGTSPAAAPPIAPGATSGIGGWPGPNPAAGGNARPDVGTAEILQAMTAGQAPTGYDTGTKSAGTTQEPAIAPPQAPGAVGGAPSNAADAWRGLGGLAGFKAPAAPQPVMSGGVAGGVHPMAGVQRAPQQSAAIAALLNAILGARGTQPLGVPALGASLRAGV